MVADGTELAGVSGRVFSVAGDSREVLNSEPAELIFKICDGVGELAENEDLLRAMLLGEQLVQLGKFGVILGIPCAGQRQDRKESFCVLFQVLAKFVNE